MIISPTLRALVATSTAIAALTGMATAQASYQTYRQSCLGSLNVPQLSAGRPFAGAAWNLVVTGLERGRSGLLLFGVRDDSLGAFSLPLDLGLIGAPGCYLNVNNDPGAGALSLSMVADPQGYVRVTIGIPNLPGLIGSTFYNQYLSLEAPSGRPLPITTTNAGRGVVGASTAVPFMVQIQPGTFQMGSNAAAGDPYFGEWRERPVHQVTISRPFWMSQIEVRQMDYLAVMGINPSSNQVAPYGGPANPVENVSWSDAMAYCAALTTREAGAGRLPAGYQYRLPTEAEWEYCCRAGTATEYYFGSTLDCYQARFAFSLHTRRNCGAYTYSTAPVGSYPSNAWGLWDMHGNVWEWCLDSGDPYWNYPAGPVTDPYVAIGTYRARRGGAYANPNWSYACRSAYREWDGPVYAANGSIGFRVVLAPILVP